MSRLAPGPGAAPASESAAGGGIGAGPAAAGGSLTVTVTQAGPALVAGSSVALKLARQCGPAGPGALASPTEAEFKLPGPGPAAGTVTP